MRLYWLCLALFWVSASGYYAWKGNDMWSFFFAGAAIFAIGIHEIVKAIDGIRK